MQWHIILDDGSTLTLFICDECGKPEARKAVLQNDWVFVEQNEYITKGYCGEECATTAKENKTLIEEYATSHNRL